MHRIRLTIGLDKEHLPSFFPGVKVIQGKLATSVALFPALPVSPNTLLTQITAAEGAHLATKTSKGAVPARTLAINTLWTSLESDCTYVEGLCNTAATPEQGLVWAEASGLHVVPVGTAVKELILITVQVGKGTVQLKANVAQLPAPSNKKSAARTYLWRHTLDGTKTFINDDPTPVANTLISGLPLGVEVGFEVAVKDSKGTSPWSQTVTAFVY